MMTVRIYLNRTRFGYKGIEETPSGEKTTKIPSTAPVL